MKETDNSKTDENRFSKWWIHIAGVIFLGAIIAGIYHSGLLQQASPENIRDQVLAFGPWGPVIYVILFTFVPLTLFPDAVLAIASGMAFGMWRGFLLTWLGALSGGSLAFWLARVIGQEAMEKLQKRMGHKPHEVPHMKGFLSVLVLRLVPLVPFDVVSYGAGLSHVRYRDFIFGTAVGIIPGVCVYVNLGDKLIDCGSTHFYWAVALLVGLTVVSGIGVKQLRNRKSKAVALKEEDR